MATRLPPSGRRRPKAQPGRETAQNRAPEPVASPAAASAPGHVDRAPDKDVIAAFMARRHGLQAPAQTDGPGAVPQGNGPPAIGRRVLLEAFLADEMVLKKP
jgi:hypothetical protein